MESIRESLEEIDVTDLDKATLRYHLAKYLRSKQADQNNFFNTPPFAKIYHGIKDRNVITTWIDRMIEVVKKDNEQKSCLSHFISIVKGRVLKWNPEDTGKHEKLLRQLETQKQAL